MTSHGRSITETVLVLSVILLMPGGASGAELSGRVQDEGGYPIEGATVSAVRIDGPKAGTTYRTKTDANGSFRIEEIPFGEYAIEAQASGFVGVCYRPVRIAYLRTSWNFKLPIAPENEGGIFSKAEVIGTLHSKGGVISFATICLFRGTQRFCAVANNLGEYHLAVDPGEYTATVVVGGVDLWRGPLVLPKPGEYRDAIMR